MDTKELLKKVRKVEIKTKRLSNNIFGGEYHSAFKGRGMTFSEVRGYEFGDDVRTIDWNVTARFNDPYVKVLLYFPHLLVLNLVQAQPKDEHDEQHLQELLFFLSQILLQLNVLMET